ncbi:hypothetical protein H4582DRAFT_2026288, partial [Lactarius indigo]
MLTRDRMYVAPKVPSTCAIANLSIVISPVVAHLCSVPTLPRLYCQNVRSVLELIHMVKYVRECLLFQGMAGWMTPKIIGWFCERLSIYVDVTFGFIAIP